ncbi:MAG: vitamin B12-transporter ATPase [Methanocella sp. PtaU1.Bin125]|nr:MAG: vitamin B12-transporter ATPase [Methanocella sp. PtaU1.Bin125]
MVVTHDVEFAAAHADRVIILAKGRVIKGGDARQVLTDENLVAAASLQLPQATLLGKSVGLDGILTIGEIAREGIP